MCVLFAGVIADVTQSHPTQCTSGADNIREDGISVVFYRHLYSYCLQVQLHELGCDGYCKSYVFRGTKEITCKQLQVPKMMSLVLFIQPSRFSLSVVIFIQYFTMIENFSIRA